MRLHIPTGLTAVLASLNQVILNLNCHPEEAPISSAFRQRLEPAYQQLRALSERHALIKREWSQVLATRNQQLGTLRRLVRDSWLMLRRRDQREGHEGRLGLLYRLPSLAPPHASAVLWLQYGRNLVVGEALAVAEGHAPMAFPSVAELAAVLSLTEVAEQAYQRLTLDLKEAEAELRQQQRQAVRLLRGLAARLREAQFDQDPAQTRNLLRTFGFRFKATPSDDPQALAELAQEQPQPLATADKQPEARSADQDVRDLSEAEVAEPKTSRTWLGSWKAWAQTPKRKAAG